MKKGFITLACATAIATLGGCGSAPATPSAEDGETRALEGMITSAMRRNGIVGLSAVIHSGGCRLLMAGYGYADRAGRIPVTPETVFPLASVTKLFTATAVIQLVERGMVDLDAPVSRYLPELARPDASTAGPTVRQLLTHHGGLSGNIMEAFELLQPDPIGFRKVPRLLGGMPPATAPDTVFAYSNAGYSLLGCLVERVSGAGYTDRVTRGILEPLGMSRTRFFLSPADAAGAAMGYDGRTQVSVYPIRDIPAGALLSTAADMEKFMLFMFAGGRDAVLGRRAFAEMTSRQNGQVALDGDFSIGLGYWLINPFPSEDAFVSHGGDVPPFHTMLVTVPERRIGIFLAANSSGGSSPLVSMAIDLARAVCSRQSGTTVSDPPEQPRVRLDRATLGRLAGSYASPMGLIEVQPRGDRLLARAMGLPLELIPRADGSLTSEVSILGLMSVPVTPLKSLRISPLDLNGHQYLRITTTGVLAGVAERLPQEDVPPAWKNRAGTYAIVPRDSNANYRWPRGISLRFDARSGSLLLSYSFPGLNGSFPLQARNDQEAVIAGVGTGLGDVIVAREEGGDMFLEWSGLLLKRE